MTIRKQFTLLSLLIIFIPIFSAIFIRISIYIQNSNSYLIHGTQNFNKYISSKLSEDELKNIHETLKVLPSDVQCILISRDNNEIVYSTFEEFIPGNTITSDFLWDFINGSSDKYFYQFTTPNINAFNSFIVTRIPIIKHHPGKRRNLYKTLMFVTSALVTLCIIFIFIISRTIFTSIIKIENKTKQLAEGKLSDQVISEDENTNKNEIISIMKGLEKLRLSFIEILNRKNKFIMGISHDLRTPVAIIKGYSEAILDGVITNETDVIQSIQLIQNRTTQLSEMINTLINYMKLNEVEMREKLLPCSITSLIKDFAKSCILTGNVFKRNIVSNIDLPYEVIIPLNEQLVIRSFENIFANALRYTKDNDSIEIISYLSNNNIIFKIKDSGIGIDEDDLDLIFDMFYRGSNSRREEGLGIGLSVVKNIIELHKWTISVDSLKGSGTCFTITIPFTKVLEEVG